MNWGYKIIIVYSIFVAGILFMVFRSSNQKTDLVTTDYYAKELKYQEKIDEMNRVSALSGTLRYEIKGNQLLLYFPEDFAGKKITGIAEIYCPSDEDKDVKTAFAVQDTAAAITIKPANKGQHELHISWQAGGLTYYFEKKIFI